MTEPTNDRSEFLGDGIYASFDGAMIDLRAPRPGGDHHVYLDREVFESLIQYAIWIGWLTGGQTIRARHPSPITPYAS